MTNILLDIQKITKAYAKKTVLQNITFSIEESQIYGLVGQNGAGKTTLIRILSELIKPNSGNIQYSENLNLSCIVESPNLYENLSGYDNLKYHALYCNMDNIDEKILNILELVGLNNVEHNKKVKNYSLGMKQRLAIGMAIIDSPTLLILDEPINGLDPMGIKDIRNILLKLKNDFHMTIFISSHILSELDLIADQFIIMDKGNIIETISYAQLKEKTALCTILEVSQIQESEDILKQLGLDVQIMHHTITITESFLSVNDIIDILRKNNITIKGIYNKQTTFEDYYLNLIQKGGH